MGVSGSMSQGTFGLVLFPKKGLQIIPGVIDSDFQGKIGIMVQSLSKAIKNFKGQRIAQLLLLPNYDTPDPTLRDNKVKEGFGSTDIIAWIKKNNKRKTFKTNRGARERNTEVMDPGADISCIARKDWPSWPVHNTSSSLMGLRWANNVAKSMTILG